MQHFRADVKELDAVNLFLGERLADCGLNKAERMQLMLAAEEVFVNIALYAYGQGQGLASISCEVSCDPATVVLEFRDRGAPFDPLAAPGSGRAAKRLEPAAAGIFLTQKLMDRVEYRYEDGCNILRMQKSAK